MIARIVGLLVGAQPLNDFSDEGIGGRLDSSVYVRTMELLNPTDGDRTPRRLPLAGDLVIRLVLC
ncbi:hypothetical protein [Rosistilla carotiformis]|uniref:hypothetical protein n=1 Tax=Rosistilla carotiformis TaxID=2528017 RepID=UPI00119EEC8E|nr:hypothetical protein [Rosistilla carotiformis]